MQFAEAITIIRELSAYCFLEIKHGEEEGQPLQKPETHQALTLALTALERIAEKTKRREGLPLNAGKAWTEGEERQLLLEFESGLSTKQIAENLQRTLPAIHSRLLRFGRVKEGELLDGVVVRRPRYDSKRGESSAQPLT